MPVERSHEILAEQTPPVFVGWATANGAEGFVRFCLARVDLQQLCSLQIEECSNAIAEVIEGISSEKRRK
jgi:hypothetical protein